MYSQTEDGFVALDNAEIVLLNNLGELIAEGTVPAGRPDSFLQIPLEDQWLNQPVSLRISGTNNSSIIWNGTTPKTSAMWLPGALFSIDETYLNTFFSSFAESTDVEIIDAVHLWGEPYSPEEWVNTTITLFDDDLQTYPVFSFSQLETGLISTNTDNKVDWFFAWNLPATHLTLSVIDQFGQETLVHYHPNEGDILSALFMTLPTAEDP